MKMAHSCSGFLTKVLRMVGYFVLNILSNQEHDIQDKAAKEGSTKLASNRF